MLKLIRGLPGAGKSTAAIAKPMESVWTLEADQYFMVNGKYEFDILKVELAHDWCQDQCRRMLPYGTVIVSNTFTQRWEMQPYIEMAEELGVEFEVSDVFDGGCSNEQLAERNVHGVPIDTIAKMRDRYEHDWKTGNPLPPWER